jgi:hypothetical protein
MMDSHNTISDLPTDEIAQVAMITLFFEFAWNIP